MSNLLGGATSPVENPVRCQIISPIIMVPFSCSFLNQIQPSSLAFSRSGCEAHIGDRVQGEEKTLGMFLPRNFQSNLAFWSPVDIYLKPFQSLDLIFQFYIGESGVLPFLLLLPLLMVSGHLHLPSLRFSTPPLQPSPLYQVNLPAHSCAHVVRG